MSEIKTSPSNPEYRSGYEGIHWGEPQPVEKVDEYGTGEVDDPDDRHYGSMRLYTQAEMDTAVAEALLDGERAGFRECLDGFHE